LDIEVINIPTEKDVINTAAIAKTSYHAGSYDTFKKLSFSDASKFLERLILIGHESAIEPLIFTFNVQGVSRVLTHQLVRHRIASYMQKSLRRKRVFTKKDFVYVPHSKNNDLYSDYFEKNIEQYNKLIAAGEHPDDARRILSMGISTEITFTMNARSLRNFLKLRLDKSANWEIRVLAAKIASILISEGLAFLIRDILIYFNKKDKKE
jgi:thymidylate synthase (FAD)